MKENFTTRLEKHYHANTIFYSKNSPVPQFNILMQTWTLGEGKGKKGEKEGKKRMRN